MPRWIFALVQFFPLSLFAAYAFWAGPPDNDRWVQAFQVASVAGLVQLAIVLPQRQPANRLVLAGNIYLIFGGIAAASEQWWYLQLYGYLRESAIFLAMLIVGVVSTVATRSGFVASPHGDPLQVRWHSLLLLVATALCLFPALAFQGERLWSAVIPIIALALLNRYLARLASGSTHGADV